MLLPGKQPGDRRLARAALADEGDHGAAVEAEADPADRVQHLAAPQPEVLVQRDRLHGQRSPLGGNRDDLVVARRSGAVDAGHVVSSGLAAGSGVSPALGPAGGRGAGVSGPTNAQAVTWPGSLAGATGARFMVISVQACVA